MEQNDIEIVGADPDPYDPIALPEDAETYPENQPYPPVELDAQEIATLEDDTAAAVATVRSEQELRIANLGLDQLAHALVNVEGAERCCSDGEPWPCATWRTEIEPAAGVESSGAAPEAAYTPGEIAAAEALGITAAEVRERMSAR